MKTTKTQTAKSKTLARYPNAYSYSWANSWVIYTPHVSGNVTIGSGKTAALAWAAASKHRGSLWPKWPRKEKTKKAA